MVYSILIVIILGQAGEGSSIPTEVPKKSYLKELIINSTIGIGFGVGAGTFYVLGNKAYENYQRSNSMESATQNYNQAVFYDNLRNVFAAGSIIFLARAVYYQLKTMSAAKTAAWEPDLDFELAGRGRFKAGLKAKL